MGQSVDGVSATMIREHISNQIIAKPTFESLQVKRHGDRVTVTDGARSLRFEIDDELIPGYPYWWWQIDRCSDDHPLDFGKASFSRFTYQTTVDILLAKLVLSN